MYEVNLSLMLAMILNLIDFSSFDFKSFGIPSLLN